MSPCTGTEKTANRLIGGNQASPFVEAAAGLLAQTALGDQSLQDLRRAKGLGAQLGVQGSGDGQTHVESDEVGQQKRPMVWL